MNENTILHRHYKSHMVRKFITQLCNKKRKKPLSKEDKREEREIKMDMIISKTKRDGNSYCPRLWRTDWGYVEKSEPPQYFQQFNLMTPLNFIASTNYSRRELIRQCQVAPFHLICIFIVKYSLRRDCQWELRMTCYKHNSYLPCWCFSE